MSKTPFGDDALLSEIGARLATIRLSRNTTQAQLAREAGVSKRTLERIEAGRSVQLTSFVRLLRALGLDERLDALLPPPQPSPIELLRREGRTPQRASGPRERSAEPWTWGDEG